MTLSIREQIEKVLEKDVRPSLAEHQGDVVIVDYADHILRIRLTGQCSGCPSAQLTTEELISAKVREAFEDVHDRDTVPSPSCVAITPAGTSDSVHFVFNTDIVL